jgi:predicted molibdopterin-dependent oxidoreductase YjgC
MGFNVNRDVVVGPEFPGKVCARGIYGTELLRHNRRIATPLVRVDGILRESSWDSAIERMASGLESAVRTGDAGSVAVVIGANRSTSELEAVAHLADVIGTGLVACAFEPQDWPLAVSGAGAAVEVLREANCIVVLGDAFTTHPVIAKTIIDAKFTARDNSLFVIDARRSNTAWYATAHLQNRPGTESLVLAAVLAALVAQGAASNVPAWLKDVDAAALTASAGLASGAVARVARAFAAAEKAAIVLAPGTRGVSDVSLVAELARLVVQSAGAGKQLVLLPSEGNVGGAVEVARRHSWQSVAQLITELESGRCKALLSVGADVASQYPSDRLSRALAGLDFVGSIALFHGETEAHADVIAAGSSWLESAGEARLFDGHSIAWSEVVPPSWATLPLNEIVGRLEAALPSPAATTKASEKPSPAGVSVPDRLAVVMSSAGSRDGTLALVTLGASGHTGSGTVTRWSQWARDMFPGGFIEMAEADAAEAGIVEGQTVAVAGVSGPVGLTVHVTDRLQPGVAAVASYDPAARGLFDWEPAADGWFATGPGSVRVNGKQSP